MTRQETGKDANMQLQNDETLIAEVRPERALLKKWFFTKGITAAFIGGFLTFWAFSFFGGFIFQTGDGFRLGAVLAVPIGIIVLICAHIYTRFLLKTYIYAITDKRVNFQGGILRYADRSVQYDRITNVEKSKNFFERLIGIESIWVHTAGFSGKQSKAEIVFEGLKDADHLLSEINKLKQK